MTVRSSRVLVRILAAALLAGTIGCDQDLMMPPRRLSRARPVI
jgi:hypothetical protein